MTNQPVIPLTMVQSGEKARLVAIHSGHELKRRLATMGLVPDEEFTVVNNGHPGPFVVKIKESKVIIGKGMAHKIMVTLVSE